MSISWIPKREDAFVAAHADGNLYSKDGPGDSTFPVIKDQTQFSVAHACSSKLAIKETTDLNGSSDDVIGENLKLKTELERKNKAEKGNSLWRFFSTRTVLIFFRRDYLCEQVNSLQEKLEMAYAIADENEAIVVSEANKIYAEQKEEEIRILENSVEELDSMTIPSNMKYFSCC
ncbi:hypothetical protein L2E82_18657 [Cichorium intybus]|uniref:Uncharacterized protein n=1 Tax=Cichorium intybus TaxID=13427 RepID=A0ACB9FB80_CICIN|nr:hypothetical protein L2E82_18657 [Cichorium intybus]